MVETVELSILDALWSLQGLRIEKEGCREETKEKKKREEENRQQKEMKGWERGGNDRDKCLSIDSCPPFS